MKSERSNPILSLTIFKFTVSRKKMSKCNLKNPNFWNFLKIYTKHTFKKKKPYQVALFSPSYLDLAKLLELKQWWETKLKLSQKILITNIFLGQSDEFIRILFTLTDFDEAYRKTVPISYLSRKAAIFFSAWL